MMLNTAISGIQGMPQQRGYSLVELMVAMVLALFILAGLATVMVNSSKNYEVQQYSSRLQENARFAVNQLSQALRMSGYYGCGGAPPGSTLVGGFSAYKGDGLQVGYVVPGQANKLDVSGETVKGSTTINVADDPAGIGIEDDVEIWISDCGGGQEAEVASFSSTQITLASPTVRKFSGNAEIRIYEQDASVIMNSFMYEVRTTAANPVPSLYMYDANVAPPDDDDLLLLSEGVEYMRLLFGEDTDGDYAPDTFVEHGSISNPDRVVAVQIGLVLRGVSNVDPESGSTKEYGIGESTGIKGGLLDKSETQMDAELDDLRVTRRKFITTINRRNMRRATTT